MGRVRAEEFDYDLPAGAIGQVPTEPRDRARLLVDRGPGTEPVDHRVHDLPELLEPGDLLVINDTRVLPARLHLAKPTGGAVEVLLLEPTGFPRQWRALVRPGKRLKAGALLHLPPAEPRSQRPPADNRGGTVRNDERRPRSCGGNDGGPRVAGGDGADDPVVRVGRTESQKMGPAAAGGAPAAAAAPGNCREAGAAGHNPRSL